MIKTLKKKTLENYITALFNERVKVKRIEPLGRGSHGQGFRIEFIRGERAQRLILKALSGNVGLGHDYPSDRAAFFLLAKDTYNLLPRHVKAIDVATIKQYGSIKSVEDGKDYFLLMEEAEGESYFRDLELMKGKTTLDICDRRRIKTMVRYLSNIHSVKKDSRTLYLRKIRDTIGHGDVLWVSLIVMGT